MTLSYPNPANGSPKLSGSTSDLLATMAPSPATVWNPNTAIEEVEIRVESAAAQRARLVNTFSGIRTMTSIPSFDLRGRIIQASPGVVRSTPIVIYHTGRQRR